MSPNAYQPPGSEPPPPPKVEIAHTLETAGEGRFVVVDGRGRVRGPAYRLLWKGGVLLFACVLVFLASFALARVRFSEDDPLPTSLLVGVVVLAALGAVAWSVLSARRLQTAMALFGANRLEEALTELETMERSAFVTRPMRRLALLNQAPVLLRMGRPEEALACARKGRRILRRGLGLRLHRALGHYHEVGALTRLGRLEEARRELASIPEPVGEYLQLVHWAEALYLDFREGAPRTTPARLALAAGLAGRAAQPGMLPALVAWAFARQGDTDRSAPFLTRAKAQLEGQPYLRALAPDLARWVEAQPSQA